MSRLMLPALALLCGALLCGAGCSPRPTLAFRPAAAGDLYWTGAFDDSVGHRWSVAIIPGLEPMCSAAGRSWRRALTDYPTWYVRSWYWRGNWDLMSDGFEFAGDAIWDFGLCGIGRDYRDTTRDLAQLVDQQPFGWIPRLLVQPLWGYLLKPCGRLVCGTVGATGGLVFAVVTPAVAIAVPPVASVGDAAILGTAVPTVLFAWQQPTWFLSIWNAEPAESMDGHWGLRIINRLPPAPVPPLTQADAAVWLAGLVRAAHRQPEREVLRRRLDAIGGWFVIPPRPPGPLAPATAAWLDSTEAAMLIEHVIAEEAATALVPVDAPAVRTEIRRHLDAWLGRPSTPAP